jgi:HEAT repeat protein
MHEDGRIATSWQYAPPGSAKTRFNTLEEYAPDTDTTRKLWITGHYVGEKAYLESNLDGGYLLSGLFPMSAGKEGIGEIHEYDWDGDTSWKYQAPGLVYASRLHGGTTVGSAEGRIIEISADRRMVGETPMENPPAVARACLGLSRFGFDTFPADADLETDIDYRVRSLTKKNPKARLFALRELASFRWWAARAIPQLKARAEDPDPAVRAALGETLVAIGIEEIPRLISDAKDPKRRVAAIGRLGGHCNGPGVLDALLSALDDDNPKVRAMAVASLGLCGQGSQSHPISTAWVYRGSADKVLPAVLKALKDPEARVKWEAIRTLGAMGAYAKSAVPELTGILKSDKVPTSRSLAAVTLGKIGDNSPPVLSALCSALADSDQPKVTIGAADGLRQLRPLPKDVAGKLIETYRTVGAKDTKDAADIRLTCLTTLRQLHAADSQTRDFMKALRDDPTQDIGTRLNALWCLFDITDERAAAYVFMANWARQEPDPAVRARLHEHVRGLKSLLNQTRASPEQ